MFAVKLERPNLQPPFLWDGLITQVRDFSVTRAIGRAGSFTVTVPMLANHAREVRRGWRVSIYEERFGLVDSAGATFDAPPILLRGKVLRRTPQQENEAGGFSLVIEGETFMGQLADHFISQDYELTSTTLNAMLGLILTPLGIEYEVPFRCTYEYFSITLADITVLDALIRLAELTRTNLTDTFSEVIKFTDQDDVPHPSTNLNVDDSVLRIVNVEHTFLENLDAAYDGFGIVSVPPTISYDGSQLANTLKPVAVDYDGSPLTIEDGTGGNFSVLAAAGVGGNTRHYIQNTESITRHGIEERQFIRADIVAKSSAPADRLVAKNTLLAVATGEMLRVNFEIFTAQVQLANGEHIYALPGERVYMRYKGAALLRDGRTVTQVDIDRWCVVMRRYDTSSESGKRLVGLDISTPETTYQNTDLPNHIAIPTPRESQLPKEKEPEEVTDEEPMMEDFYPYIDPGAIKDFADEQKGIGELQPCCAPPTKVPPEPTDEDGGGIPIPVRSCYVPWTAAAVQTFRFVEKWGNGWADPGLGDGLINPDTDRAIVVLISSSADPVLVVSGATATELAAYDSPSPANFGGDGNTWWRFYYLIPTADLIDFAGSTGAFREVTFFRAQSVIVEKNVVDETSGSSGGGTTTNNKRRKVTSVTIGDVDGVDFQFTSNLEYHGSSFGEAIETAVADTAAQYGDLVWSFINSVYRSIDSITFTKEFNAPAVPFDHDYIRINSEFVTFTPSGGDQSATDWDQSDARDDGFGSHSYTMRFTGDAVASDFPGACRILVIAASLRLRALCERHLIA